jgi:hypothetical protein
VFIQPDHSVSFRLDDLKGSHISGCYKPNGQYRRTKSETLIVVNIGGYGMAPCVTIEPLIRTIRIVFRSRRGDTLGSNSKKTSPLYKGGRYCTL